MTKTEIIALIQKTRAEIADFRERLNAVRNTDPVTARWYAERIANPDDKRRELEWEIH